MATVKTIAIAGHLPCQVTYNNINDRRKRHRSHTVARSGCNFVCHLTYLLISPQGRPHATNFFYRGNLSFGPPEQIKRNPNKNYKYSTKVALFNNENFFESTIIQVWVGNLMKGLVLANEYASLCFHCMYRGLTGNVSSCDVIPVRYQPMGIHELWDIWQWLQIILQSLAKMYSSTTWTSAKIKGQRWRGFLCDTWIWGTFLVALFQVSMVIPYFWYIKD